MTFIAGPRQCGKTTLAQHYLRKHGYSLDQHYWSWDDLRMQRRIRAEPYAFEVLQRPNERVPIVFDELHTMRRWKSYLKGAYDSFRDRFFSSLPSRMWPSSAKRVWWCRSRVWRG